MIAKVTELVVTTNQKSTPMSSVWTSVMKKNRNLFESKKDKPKLNLKEIIR